MTNDEIYQQRESEEIKVELCRKNVRKGTAETEDKDMDENKKDNIIINILNTNVQEVFT